MDKVTINILITVKADRDDDDAIREAVQDKLVELIEAEELEFTVLNDDDDDEVDDYV